MGSPCHSRSTLKVSMVNDELNRFELTGGGSNRTGYAVLRLVPGTAEDFVAFCDGQRPRRRPEHRTRAAGARAQASLSSSAGENETARTAPETEVDRQPSSRHERDAGGTAHRRVAVMNDRPTRLLFRAASRPIVVPERLSPPADPATPSARRACGRARRPSHVVSGSSSGAASG